MKARPSFHASAAFVLAVCVFYWADGLGLFWPLVLSAALHEAAHLAMLRLCRVPVEGIRLTLTGAVIQTGAMAYGQEALCAAAGPCMNMGLALLFHRLWPALCLMSTLLAAYNLLPVYPLDGGRLVRALLLRLLGLECGLRFSRLLSLLTISGAAGLCVWLTCRRHLGLWPCIFAALLLLKLPRDAYQGINFRKSKKRD